MNATSCRLNLYLSLFSAIPLSRHLSSSTFRCLSWSSVASFTIHFALYQDVVSDVGYSIEPFQGLVYSFLKYFRGYRETKGEPKGWTLRRGHSASSLLCGLLLKILWLVLVQVAHHLGLVADRFLFAALHLGSSGQFISVGLLTSW